MAGLRHRVSEGVHHLSPLAITSIGLAALFAAVVGWLAFSADEPEGGAIVAAAPDESEPLREVPLTAGQAAKPAATPVDAVIALVPAPLEDLTEKSKHGPLPTIAEDGRQPWQVYARPYAGDAATPRIAIVVGWLGLRAALAQRAINELPGTVTLGISPYSRNAQELVNQARVIGHEVVLMVPMEPLNYPASDPGPHTLLTDLQPIDNIDRLEWLMSRIAGYVAVTDDMGSKFTATEAAIRPVLRAFKRRGLMYLDSRSAADSVASRVASELALPRAISNRLIDSVATAEAIDARLAELERIATVQGAAVGMAQPYPVVIARLKEWIRTLPDKNISLAPLTALANRQAGE